jgi:putative membrane protein
MDFIKLTLAIALAVMTNFSSPRVYADDQKTDGEIVGILMASDKNEIAVAQQAEGRNLSPEVMDFAKMLETEHQDDLNTLQTLSQKEGIQPPATAGMVIRAKGAKNLAMLMPQNGKDYEKSFVNAMVQDHIEDLDLIDKDLMKDVHNPALKAQLADTRSHVAMHLDKAKQLQVKE